MNTLAELPYQIELGFIFFLGLFIGSFLNVLIDRLPAGQGIGGRSMCDFCKRTLDPHELIPVLSYLWQKGKSLCCNRKLSVQYPLIEVVTAIVFTLTWARFGSMGTPFELMASVLMLVVMSALIVIVVTDIKEHIIPDYMTLTIIIAGGALAFLNSVFLSNLIAGLILFGILFAIFAATKGRGMGFGDVKFALAMGILLGLKAGLLALYLSFVAGGIIGLVLVIFGGKGMKTKIAFGPFLVLGTVLMFFYGTYFLRLSHELFGGLYF